MTFGWPACAQVAADFSAKGHIVVGPSTTTCGSLVAGGIRWNSPNLQYCDGTAWQTVSGTGTSGVAAAGNTGDIQFNNAGVLGADTANLFWDNTNKRLGIGTVAPSTALQVTGNLKFTSGALLDSTTIIGSNQNDLSITTPDYLYAAGSYATLLGGTAAAPVITMYNNKVSIGLTYGAGLDLSNPVTAAAGAAYGTRLQQSLGAAANNDTLYGLYINPTYTPGSYTGVTDYDLAFAKGAARTIAVMSNGTSAGNGLTLQAGYTSGGNNIAGGDLTLSSGQGTGTAGSNIIFKTSVAGTTGTGSNTPAEAMRITNTGHVETPFFLPAISACGAGPSVAGNDNSAIITVGTGTISACTMTFAHPWTNTPVCNVTPSYNVLVYISSASASAITVSMSGPGDGQKLYVNCRGYR